MAQFVKVTRVIDEREVWVNLDRIESMVVLPPKGETPRRTVVHMARESQYVIETPEQIMSRDTVDG